MQSGDKMATAELGGGPGGRGDGVAGWQQLQDGQQWEVVAANCRDTEHHTTEISLPLHTNTTHFSLTPPNPHIQSSHTLNINANIIYISQ